MRTKYLLQLLDNPQEKIKVIHIAGTSGKGSTAYMTSLLLAAHGFKVGLQVSPHLLDIRERFQIYTEQSRSIDSQLISKEQFMQFVAEIMPYVERAKETKWGRLTFFEINVCLAFHIFYKEKIDYAVMETGLGGLYDGTNVVKNPHKLVLLTKIGFDHQNVLGHTLSATASQKAGIIQKGNTLITVQQKTQVMDVFNNMIKRQSATSYIIKKEENYKYLSTTKTETNFDYSFQSYRLPRLRLGLIGEHQAENASIALTALCVLSQQHGFVLRKPKIYPTLQNAFFRGRLEIHHTKNRDLVIDGAHNPQKMKAFITTLIHLYPMQTFDFIIAFSDGKNQVQVMREMLKIIILVANSIMLTGFVLKGDDVLHLSVPKERIIHILNQFDFKNYSFHKINEEMMNYLMKENARPLVITGSLYLIGSIYTSFDSFVNSR